jgi:4a-hydroxytetrahydrobiopterin dehydratase
MSWQEVDGKLTRSFTFGAFLDGIAFVQQVALVAEELDHHPDIDVRWRTVTLAVNTHDAGNAITAKDYELAARVDALSR